jgi:type II secretory pathway component GspD/PulD (secretin)
MFNKEMKMATSKQTTWYETSTSNHQGVVAEEETGRTVAVAYDKADALLIAAAPDLLAALEGLLEGLTPSQAPSRQRAACDAISKATGRHET